MQDYTGTKQLKAKPMTRGEYNEYRGWKIPSDEDPYEAGYLVEYTDGGKPNDGRHAGYISWSPADVFERAYRTDGKLSFGDVLIGLKQGKRYQRHGWNGKGMFIELQQPDAQSKMQQPYIYMSPVCGRLVPWLASQADMLAEDWQLVPS